MRQMVVYVAYVVLMLFCLPQTVGALPKSTLTNHRAVYALQLDRTGNKSSIANMSGRIVYEFNHAACEGFTTRFRFVTRFEMEGMPPQTTDQQVTSFESADGTQFHFVNKSYTDQELTKEIEGMARHEMQKIIIDITRPEVTRHELPFAQFPTWHTQDLINRASRGEVFYQTALYDGSDDATKISQSVVVIGKKHHAVKNEETSMMGVFGDDPVWPVTVAYFDDSQNRDGLPIYRTSFLLHPGGITRDLLMDYGDFAIRGKLVRFDVLDETTERSDCPAF